MKSLSLLSEAGPDSSLSWLLWVVLILFLLIVLIGWWVSNNKGNQVEGKEEAHSTPHDKPDTEKPADDLTSLEGIGPKVSQILNQAGYMTFADLAKADSAEVDKVLDANRLQMMDSAGWIEQAKLAATGDLEGLARLQDELKGGRKA